MKVTPYEGLHRFLVESGGSDSEMEGGAYLVDLAANAGIGFCGCKRWGYKVSPRLTAGEHPIDLFDKLFSCSHIRAARSYQYEEWFWLVMAREPNQDT